MSVQVQQAKTSWFMIVTSQMYSHTKFVAEAKKLGVNRAIAARVLRHMEWHDPVFLSDWVSTEAAPNVRRIVTKTETGRSVYAPTGKAIVFGYFNIDQVIPNGFTDEAREEFHKRLDIVREIAMESVHVARKCGSYDLGGGFQVRDSIEKIVEKAEIIAKKYQLKLKWFAGGAIHEIAQTEVPNVKYSRAPYKIQATSLPHTEKTPEAFEFVRFMGGYERKIYVTKQERDQAKVEEPQ